ncbi:hypothetical protein OV203_42945 [Nannocystis sp. ILAH1]|uniref:hypothetical protein n=1 Tax=Nannocystis sp. ILAH1 TaxID=2996789 RepID=UPI0022717A63|nr:hypothetical protein [Nannocystis sp. ILAH1]MCY0993974.1 hypothetical protein [Nannocystis sp. ILAH1]
MTSLSRVVATIVAGLSWAAARPAWAHCGDECTNPLPLFLSPTSSVLAADGVLAFSPGYERAERALEFLTLKVLDAMGEEVAGAFEVHADFSVFIWRPAQPWSAGATYTVVTYVDTAAWATAEYGAQPGACVTHEREMQVTIAAEPLPAPAAPPLVVTSEHVVETWDALADLVCCDGAYPRRSDAAGHCPGLDGYQIEYAGFCTRLREHGRLEVVYDFDREALGAVAASNFAGRLFGPDDQPWIGVQANLRAPGCLRFEALDLARGEVFVDERCHGDDLADALGPLDIDPTATLAASCAGQAYVCEGEDSWDPEKCTTWPDGQVYPAPVAPPDGEPPAGETAAVDPGEQVESGGGGCSTHERPGWLALVVLGGLLRRRRARR